jgi:hypothetical protein
MGHQSSVVYSQKNTKMKYNKNITLFNEEQQKFVADTCEGLMRTFGYAQEGEFHAILSEDDQFVGTVNKL